MASEAVFTPSASFPVRFFASPLSPPQPLGHQSFELRLELRVEPAVEDGVGESRGHGDRVAEAEAQVEAALVGLRTDRTLLQLKVKKGGCKKLQRYIRH